MPQLIHVGIIMGSQSDLQIANEAAAILDKLNIGYEISIVSAHRTPERMFEYAKEAAGRGIESNYCRCRRSSTFTRYGCFNYSSSRGWSANSFQQFN